MTAWPVLETYCCRRLMQLLCSIGCGPRRMDMLLKIIIRNFHSLSRGLSRKRILDFKYAYHCVHKGIPCVEWAWMTQSVQPLANGLRVLGSKPSGCEILRTHRRGPEAHIAFYEMGTWLFPQGKRPCNFIHKKPRGLINRQLFSRVLSSMFPGSFFFIEEWGIRKIIFIYRRNLSHGNQRKPKKQQVLSGDCSSMANCQANNPAIF